MATKKKRRKRKSRLPKTSLKEPETPTQQRKKFPKALVNAYLNLDKTKVKVKELGIEHYAWTDEAYEAYAAEARKYLGDKADDSIESGKLIVLLHRATADKKGKKK